MSTVVRAVLIALGVAMLAAIGLVTYIGLMAYTTLRRPYPRTEHVKLKSGREVEVVWSGTVNGSSPAWIFQYRTRIPLRDRYGLQREVAALWHDIESQADRAGMSRASVWPMNFDREVRFDGWKPVIIGPLSTAFGFEKNADGIWETKGGWFPTEQSK